MISESGVMLALAHDDAHPDTCVLRSKVACDFAQVALDCARMGSNEACDMHAALMTDGVPSGDGWRKSHLSKAVNAFLSPMTGGAAEEAREARVGGNAKKTSVARLAWSLSATAALGGRLATDGGRDMFTERGRGLRLAGWEELPGSHSGCVGQLAYVGQSTWTLSAGKERVEELKRATREVNRQCWPFYPVETGSDGTGAWMSVDSDVACACFLAARMAHAPWAMQWAYSEAGQRTDPHSLSDEDSLALWIAAMAQTANEGLCSAQPSVHSPLLSAGYNAGLRLVLGPSDRLRRLGESTLIGLSLDAPSGKLAQSLEGVMERSNARGQELLAPTLARIQRCGMERMVNKADQESLGPKKGRL